MKWMPLSSIPLPHILSVIPQVKLKGSLLCVLSTSFLLHLLIKRMLTVKSWDTGPYINQGAIHFFSSILLEVLSHLINGWCLFVSSGCCQSVGIQWWCAAHKLLSCGSWELGFIWCCTLGHNKSFLAWLIPSRTGYLSALWSSYLGDLHHFPWRDTFPSDLTSVIFRGWGPRPLFQMQLSMPTSLESDHSYLASLPSNYRLLTPLSHHHSSQMIMCWPGRQVKYFCILHIWFKDRCLVLRLSPVLVMALLHPPFQAEFRVHFLCIGVIDN